MARPVLIRPNARFECHSDGTCCTTIHLLGPLKKEEAKAVERHARLVLPTYKSGGTVFHEGIKEPVFGTHNQRCVFMDDNARCRFHTTVGEACRPQVCRRFPLGATKTPHGTRITVSHRCPCVSIGEGRPLDEARARACLSSAKTGKITHDVKVDDTVLWRGDKAIDFNAYVAWETNLIEQLDGAGPQPRLSHVLGMDHSLQLPRLRKKSWNDFSKRMLVWVQDEDEEDGFFSAIRWAALELRDAPNPWSPPMRPWDWTLRRTAQRVVNPDSPRRIYGSWLADYIWAMAWTAEGSVYQAKANMTARYALARRIASRLNKTGTRADLAAAEAIMIVDVVGASEPWEWVQKLLVEDP